MCSLPKCLDKTKNSRRKYKENVCDHGLSKIFLGRAQKTCNHKIKKLIRLD